MTVGFVISKVPSKKYIPLPTPNTVTRGSVISKTLNVVTNPTSVFIPSIGDITDDGTVSSPDYAINGGTSQLQTVYASSNTYTATMYSMDGLYSEGINNVYVRYTTRMGDSNKKWIVDEVLGSFNGTSFTLQPYSAYDNTYTDGKCYILGIRHV